MFLIPFNHLKPIARMNLLIFTLLLNTVLSLIIPTDNSLENNKSNQTKAEINENSTTDNVAEFVEMQKLKQEFPKWLQDFTKLNKWPQKNPPYIPLDFIDFSKIPNIPLRQPSSCPSNRDQCSFDCFKCVSYDDVYTCPKLSQTFDDGPSKYTLNLLNNLKSKSTFFTLGLNVVKNPEIYKEIKKRGHLIGSHTWSHKFLPSLTNEQIIAQFEWSIWAMNATGNHLPKWYRPPYGGIDDRVRSIARMFGMQAVLWDNDSFDWQMESKPRQRSKSQIIKDIEIMKLKGKGLLLEHDVYKSTTEVGIEINKLIGSNQLTVAQCVGGLNYVKEF